MVSDTSTPPRDRAAVSAALIEAFIQFFADRLPEQITVREIAACANVNQGLVHEHFGAKDGLITETIHHLAQTRAAIANSASSTAASMAPLFEFQAQHPAFARLLAWWLLQGRDIAALDLEFGPINRLVDRDYGPDVTQRVDRLVVAAAIGMLVFGSVVFRDYADARGLAEISDEQFVAELALLASSLHDWNRAAD